MASVSDTLLNGADDGDAGSNYVATLNWRNVVLTPSEARKLHAQSHAKPGGALAHRYRQPINESVAASRRPGPGSRLAVAPTTTASRIRTTTTASFMLGLGRGPAGPEKRR